MLPSARKRADDVFARVGQCLQLLVCTAVFDLSAVLWANIVGTQVIPTASDMDRFTIGHVRAESGTLWVHFVSVMLKTAVALLLMYRVREPAACQQHGTLLPD